ncbi:putative phosphatidate phosphatase isoform X2 [Onthophagus taurus]|uniref:putative phosphatidate phosphatase isoform X2 n=1 Tax=Onthophagus taurus TaxID=166361 RepID=UPI000C1FEC1C|nr:putative phosphatidate phosphatase isoform X1 [Onthophagus taurus]
MAQISQVIPPTKVFLDVFLLLCVGFPILFLFLWAQPYERGFFCNDESLMHPYHESTVPSIYLYIVGLGMNCIVMILTEFLTHPRDTQVKCFGRTIPSWAWKSYCVIGVFGFGAACSQLTTDVMKYTVGRLRPHFLTVCRPDIDCTLAANQHKFHEYFKCSNSDFMNNRRIMKEMRLSFPSGHSSFSMYTMVYFAIYLQSRMTWNGSKLLRHALQFIAVLAAIFTGMTRISDYKHHWSDVLAGFSIGAVVAIVVAKYVSDLFPAIQPEDDHHPTEMNHLNGRNGHAQSHV